MTEKCRKYEILTNFGTEEELLKHVEECADCKAEHEKMLAVSALIQEAKPYYFKQKSKSKKLKIACAMFLIMFAGTFFGILNYNYDIIDNLTYGSSMTIEDMGFPTDDYGFIMVD